MGWKQLQLMLKYSEDLATNVSVCARHFFWGTKHPTFFLDDFNIDKNNCTETTRHKLPYHVLKILQNVNKEPTKTEKNKTTHDRLKSSVSPGFPPFCHLGLHKFTGQNPADVQVLRVGFERLVVSQDLCSAGGGHRSHQQAVAKSMLGLRKTKLHLSATGQQKPNKCAGHLPSIPSWVGKKRRKRQTQTHTTSSVH